MSNPKDSRTEKKHNFTSIEQAANYLKEVTDDVAQIKAGKKKSQNERAGAKVSLALEEDRKKYLNYCINQIKDKRAKALLALKISGHSNAELAAYFGVPIDMINQAEKEALEMVKVAIHKLKNDPRSVAILGGGLKH